MDGRLQRCKLQENRQEQQKRMTSLIFSGRALQALAHREEAAHLIRSVVQRHMGHILDSEQVRALIRVRNGKVLVEFVSAAPGSDRDLIFRNKSKLKGSGLFIAESLTP